MSRVDSFPKPGVWWHSFHTRLGSSAKVGCGVQPPPRHRRQTQRSPTVLVIPAQQMGGNQISPSCSMFSSPLAVLGELGALLWEEGAILLSQEPSGLIGRPGWPEECCVSGKTPLWQRCVGLMVKSSPSLQGERVPCVPVPVVGLGLTTPSKAALS